MERKDEIAKRSVTLNLLERAKEMEILMKKVPVHINKNTILLVTAEKLQRMSEIPQKKRSQKR